MQHREATNASPVNTKTTKKMEKHTLKFGGTVSIDESLDVRWDQDPCNNRWFSPQGLTPKDIKKAQRLEAIEQTYKEGQKISLEPNSCLVTHKGLAVRGEFGDSSFFPLDWDYEALGLGSPEIVKNEKAKAAAEIALTTFHTWESMKIGAIYKSTRYPEFRVTFIEEDGKRYAELLPYRWRVQILPSRFKNKYGTKIKAQWSEKKYDWACLKEARWDTYFHDYTAKDTTKTDGENESRSGFLGADWND